MSKNILSYSGLRMAFADKVLFENTNINIGIRDKICLVGRNGSGKSTLLKLITNDIDGDWEDHFIQPGITIGFLAQESNFGKYKKSLEYVLSGCNEVQIEENNGNVEYLAKAWLDKVGMGYDLDLAKLSGGEAKRVSIARAFVGDPDLLMIDEPTNHLDIEGILWLEDIIKGFHKAAIIISHDRAFLGNVSNKTWWIDNKNILSNNKGFANFDEWCDQVYLAEQKRMERMNKMLQQEQKWLSQGISARRKRNQGRLNKLYALREQKAQQISRQSAIKFNAGDDEKKVMSKMVVECKAISKAYGGKPLFNDFTTRILKEDRIGIAGPNGCGKTTLLRVMLGDEAPDAGRVRQGITMERAYIDQNRSELFLNKTPWEILCPNGGDHVNVHGKSRHVVAYLKDFMFNHEQAHMPIKAFSGGERNRLMLAKVLAQPSNFLILDEPTNDLDMDTLEMLKEMLLNYRGTVIVVSHDRDFLDNVVNSMIVLDGKGAIGEYAGGYSDYLVQHNKMSKKGLKALNKEKAKKSAIAQTAPEEETEQQPVEPVSKKLSFKQKYRLEQLPELIGQCEEQIKEIELKLANNSIYSDDLALATKLGQDSNQLRKRLEQLEDEWLELEELQLQEPY